MGTVLLIKMIGRTVSRSCHRRKLTVKENEHITHVTKTDLYRITDTDMWLSSDWRIYKDGEEIREWWEIESIQNGKMEWKALRMCEDKTTYTATFEMTKVK